MKSVFDQQTVQELIARIDKLTPSTRPKWGKMDVAQMLAHCNVTYELIYENKHKKPGAFARWLLKLLVKKIVVGDQPYKRESRTAPQFLITGPRDFNAEKIRLKDYLVKTQNMGASFFEGKESHSFGKLSVNEWNNMMYKHLDHHLTQFGV